MHKKIGMALRSLEMNETGIFYAGLPSFTRNFSRDSIIYGLLSGDPQALLAQIDYSSKHQGKTSNALTGEELGKIHHEFPAGVWRGRATTYNACDTAALYLIAIGKLAEMGYGEVLEKYRESINNAVHYILSHLREDLFYEDPRLCGAKNFAVRVTYWKDSVLNGPYEEPNYPIVYSLVHFQSAYALQIIGRATGTEEWVKKGAIMKTVGVDMLWAGDHFITAKDANSFVIDPPSSDSLHSLLYLEPNEIKAAYVKSIDTYSSQLVTTAGFMSGISQTDNPDTYHTRYLWVFEQALLHAAARKHSLKDTELVAERVMEFMDDDSFPELLDAENGFIGAGNSIQLWSVGAYRYFNNPSASFV